MKDKLNQALILALAQRSQLDEKIAALRAGIQALAANERELAQAAKDKPDGDSPQPTE